MIQKRRRRRADEDGQVIVLFAIAIIVLLAMLALALDGSYGLVQVRRAQNGADFASLAGTVKLENMCLHRGAAPTTKLISDTIQGVMARNAPDAGIGWTAEYIKGDGSDTGRPVDPALQPFPPPDACGVSVNANPKWRTYLAGIMGANKMTAVARAASANKPDTTEKESIVALNKVGPHSILGGGLGSFIVEGDMILNSTNTQYWTNKDSSSPQILYNDVVDAKEGSSLNVYGTVFTPRHVPELFPLDWCFGKPGGWTTPWLAQPPNVPPGALTRDWPNVGNLPPLNTPPCAVGAQFNFNFINNTSQDPIDDPLAGVADPLLDSSGLCPGQTIVPKFSAPLVGPGQTGGVFKPGEYDYPVHITSSAELLDCKPGLPIDTPDALGNYNSFFPGVYRFPKGLVIDVPRGQSVTGNNIELVIGSTIKEPGNVPGTLTGAGKFLPSGVPGNGAPCMPAGAVITKGMSSQLCGGTSPPLYGVNTTRIGPASAAANPGPGTGMNYSLEMGGQPKLGAIPAGTITLNSPKEGILLFQSNSVPFGANFGINAQPGDGAVINLAGLVYNASLPNYGAATAGSPDMAVPYAWGDAVPLATGGTLQTGYGTTSSVLDLSQGPVSTGSVTIRGVCLVDDFNTDGASNITVFAAPYAFPNGGLRAELKR